MSRGQEQLVVAVAVAAGFLFIYPKIFGKGDDKKNIKNTEPVKHSRKSLVVKFSDDCEAFFVGDINSDDLLLGSKSPSGLAQTARDQIAGEALMIYRGLRKEGKDFLELTQSIIDEMLPDQCRFNIVGDDPITLAQGLLAILIMPPVLGEMKREELADVYVINKALDDYDGSLAPVNQIRFNVKEGFLEDNIKSLFQLWKNL